MYGVCNRWELRLPHLGLIYIDKHSSECRRVNRVSAKFEMSCPALSIREQLQARSIPKAQLEAERVVRAVLDEIRRVLCVTP